MTDNQKEAIEYFKKRIDICMENANICDDNDFDEEATYLRKEQILIETVLNLIQTQQAEIEHQKEKRENQKKELAILNEKQKEFNKLRNTVNSYKGQFKRQQVEIEKKEKMINSIKEYAQQEIDFTTEDIEDYIDDDREGNKDIIGELKEWREHWKDIIRIMNNEKTYIDFEYKVTDTNVGERKVENGN